MTFQNTGVEPMTFQNTGWVLLRSHFCPTSLTFPIQNTDFLLAHLMIVVSICWLISSS